MGGCSAPNCSNSTNMGKQLFRFPKDPVRNKKWVMNSRREFEPTSHSRLCQDHFEQSQFEEIARSPAGGKKLKPNAIPTLFSCGDPLYPAVTTPYILLPLKPEPVEKELNIGDHGYARRTPLPGMEEYDADWSVEGRQPCTQCHLLQTLLEHEMQHTARLQKEAEEMKKRLYRLDRLERGLQNFLYEDQIRALSLTKRSRRAVWSPETILKARKIRCAVGFKGYEYLRELGYPLPTYRTLCNRLETKITIVIDFLFLASYKSGTVGPFAAVSFTPGTVQSLTWAYIGGLRDKLNRSNLTEVSFVIVNEREAQSRAMYWELKRRAPAGIPVYQQAPLQNDVWEALDGDKDDFLVYDRLILRYQVARAAWRRMPRHRAPTQRLLCPQSSRTPLIQRRGARHDL
ncbi:hypothetical protein F2P81_001016 [Scophthalmus maximus]|uniref:THAP-type domain-containing protein n=1 Tax=Scophthalmus maximus TaxID=52904 RepID=A0A6A4TMJ4_SCOMX|nr:hypothetical protein F2P81_001016 [Scophthalmus maximus]